MSRERRGIWVSWRRLESTINDGICDYGGIEKADMAARMQISVDIS